MKILALEFSSDARSVAVIEAAGHPPECLVGSPSPVAEPVTPSTVHETGAGATKAMALVESALAQAGVAREEIWRVAVGLGPGSYAGIRVALALAQGWQLARGVGLVGLSSVDTLAAQAQEEGSRGRLHTVIDAQRNEVYLAAYELDAEGWRTAAPLRLAGLDEVRALAAKGEQVAGPEAPRWCETGRVIVPQARHLGLMAAGRPATDAGETLEPVYLRPVSFMKATPLIQAHPGTRPA
jgi:tRNA threonylcarbamoyl adenosine modification protein YeaZ